jgi:signal transduction histidine kinase/ligand-binding sensor domain-containing protein/CheY-like chemotaxis protein
MRARPCHDSLLPLAAAGRIRRIAVGFLPAGALALLLSACAVSPGGTTAPEPPAAAATPAALAADTYVAPIPLPGNPELRLSFEHLFLDDGLSQSVVAAIAQDPRGFLWFGTQDGLNRFDGYEFRVFKFDRDDPDSLSASLITQLLIDARGDLWVGTNAGLDRYDRRAETFHRIPSGPQGLSDPTVNALAADADGALWVGTPNGLNRIAPDGEAVTQYFNDALDPDSLLSSFVSTLFVDRQGSVWIGTNLGLDRLDPGTDTFTHYVPDSEDPSSLLGPAVAAIQEDRFGELWVGTASGLNRLDRQTGSFERFVNDPDDPESLSGNTVTDVFEDSHGALWIGTTTGLNRFDREGRRFLRATHNPLDPESLANDSVAALFEDASGIIWVGTFGGGVDRYDPRRSKFLSLVHSPSDPGSLSDDMVWSIVRDSRGALWVATYAGGLNRADSGAGSFIHYRNDPQDAQTLSSDLVWKVYEDRDGTIWAGTSAGLDRLDRMSGRFRRYATPPVFALLQTGNGDLWVGTLGGGLGLLDPVTGSLRTYQADPDSPGGLSGNFVTALAEAADGRLWVGTFSDGLNLFDPATGQATVYRSRRDDPGSLPADTVLSLLGARQGTLWVGTGAGLARFDSAAGSFMTYDESDGLPNATIYAVLEDEDGRLWLSTNRGLSRFDPATGAVTNFDESDGLKSAEFNQGAASTGPDGEMYFGGLGGLTAFRPAAIRENPYLPPVVISNMLVLHNPLPIGGDSPLTQAVPETDEIELSYQDDFLDFEFASLHFSSPQENEYAYLLEGFDRAWNYVGTRRLASYTGLPPGSYTFRVRGTNSDGVWSGQSDSIRIVLPPPFWETWWFRGIALGLLVGVVAAGLALRLRVLEGQRRRLELVVEQRTAELRAAMADLQRAKEAAEAANRAKSAFLANVSHELRTPLNAILGFTQLMIRSAGRRRAGDVQPEDLENLQVIQRSGEHLLGLINEVLELSKIEAGRSALRERAFDLRRLIEGLEDMFRLRAEQKGLTFEVDLAAPTPAFVTADEGKLRQILMNLLGNAVKFTDQGGVVLRSALAEEDDAGLSLRVEVEDSGPGIPPADHEAVFAPFVQSRLGEQSREGTGLGLSISREFARAMGGDLTLTSETGRGSLFRLQIPVRPAEPIGEQAPRRVVVGLEPGQPTYRLLVVDDNETNRRLLVRLLRPLGFEVREAVHGGEALAIWEEWSPHLIWMDMRMPVMDGYEATRRIKSTTRGQATVIIALTASALEEDRAVILSEGCDDYVRKPFREEELFDTLTRHLGVRFLTEELAPPSTGGRTDQTEILREIAGLPAEWRQRLRQAITLGSKDGILSELDQARTQAPQAAAELRRLAEVYDHGAMLDLLEEAERQG